MWLYTCARPALSMQAHLREERLRIPSGLDAASGAPGANLTHRLKEWPQALMNFTGALSWFAPAQNAPQANLSQHTRRYEVMQSYSVR